MNATRQAYKNGLRSVDLLRGSENDISDLLDAIKARNTGTDDALYEALAHYCKRINQLQHGEGISARYATTALHDASTGALMLGWRQEDINRYTMNDVALAMAFSEYVAEHLDASMMELDLTPEERNPLVGMGVLSVTIRTRRHRPSQIWDLLHTLHDLNTHEGDLGDWDEAYAIKESLGAYAELTFLRDWLANDNTLGVITPMKLQETLYDILALPGDDALGWPTWKEWQLQRAIGLLLGSQS